MSKFKVGDRVRSISWASPSTGTIHKKEENEKYVVKLDTKEPPDHASFMENGCFCIYQFGSELCKTNDNGHKILITTDGPTTTARLYGGKKVIKSAKAKCSPGDTFDFNIGAKLAFDRLMGTDSAEEPEYYSGKVVCVMSTSNCFTVGKIYTFENGQTLTDGGAISPMNGNRVETFEGLRDNYNGVKFIKFKGE